MRSLIGIPIVLVIVHLEGGYYYRRLQMRIKKNLLYYNKARNLSLTTLVSLMRFLAIVPESSWIYFLGARASTVLKSFSFCYSTLNNTIPKVTLLSSLRASPIILFSPSVEASSRRPMNVSAIINIFRLVRDPALCLPHASVSTLNHLPVPISSVFTNGENELKLDIRAVVLDKDNCFAYPKENAVYKPYEVRFRTSLSRPP